MGVCFVEREEETAVSMETLRGLAPAWSTVKCARRWSRMLEGELIGGLRVLPVPHRPALSSGTDSAGVCVYAAICLANGGEEGLRRAQDKAARWV